ncbi:MAG TPA: hypothetical protein VEL47_07345 [Myxococcota bacterium]|nr:hypothetical protein [Myxococcota bacterium]
MRFFSILIFLAGFLSFSVVAVPQFSKDQVAGFLKSTLAKPYGAHLMEADGCKFYIYQSAAGKALNMFKDDIVAEITKVELTSSEAENIFTFNVLGKGGPLGMFTVRGSSCK